MNENSKQISIKLDPKSIEILKSVNEVFRDSIINLGIRMVHNTPLFDTITGKEKESNIEEMTSLDSLDSDATDVTKVEEVKTKPQTKPSTSWTDF